MLQTILQVFKALKDLWDIGHEIISYHIIDKLYYKGIKGESFYFKSYCKHLTLYKNGHGILIESCYIRVLDDENFTNFYRELDISDGKKYVCFNKSLHELKNVSHTKRFTEMGFWCDADGDKSNNLIRRITQVESNNNKVLKWDFEIDKRVLKSKKKKIFYLTYALSIPGMFPVQDGYLDTENLPEEDYSFCSSLQVKTRIRELKYIFSLEKGIELITPPIFNETCCKKKFNDRDRNKTLRLEYKNEIFYDKYSVTVMNPKYQNSISVLWGIGERAEEGGMEMLLDKETGT